MQDTNKADLACLTYAAFMGHKYFVVETTPTGSELRTYAPSLASAKRGLLPNQRVYQWIKTGTYRRVKVTA